jgi:hypothetical protein
LQGKDTYRGARGGMIEPGVLRRALGAHNRFQRCLEDAYSGETAAALAPADTNPTAVQNSARLI